MRWDISQKRFTSDTDFHWQFLCSCFDHEALGIVERALLGAGFNLKTVKVEPVRPISDRPGD